MLRNRSATLFGLAIVVSLTAGCGQQSKETARVIVPRGATLRAAADSMAKAGLVRWPKAFLLYARVTANDRDIKAGTYLLNKGTSWGEIVKALSGGSGIVSNLTIPEGFTLAQIVQRVSRSLSVPVESVEVAVRDSGLRAHVGTPVPTLEGYLFPDTYAFPVGTSARTVVTELVRRFDRAWKPAWSARLDTLQRSRHEVVTMASIVEKEAKVATERPVIAGVYYNRLEIKMPLQADPTIQYAAGKHLERVMYKDLEVNSPYNTYKHAGLPPGPIASPGSASLEAALYPADVTYLYFVASPDGSHQFRNTLPEHELAKQSSRAALDSIARATKKDSASLKRDSAKKSSAKISAKTGTKKGTAKAKSATTTKRTTSRTRTPTKKTTTKKSTTKKKT